MIKHAVHIWTYNCETQSACPLQNKYIFYKTRCAVFSQKKSYINVYHSATKYAQNIVYEFWKDVLYINKRVGYCEHFDCVTTGPLVPNLVKYLTCSDDGIERSLFPIINWYLYTVQLYAFPLYMICSKNHWSTHEKQVLWQWPHIFWPDISYSLVQYMVWQLAKLEWKKSESLA